MSPPFTAAELMFNLEAELMKMAQECDSLQTAAGVATRSAQDDLPQQSYLISEFQKIDTLSQSIRDLARLAGTAARSSLSEIPVDVDLVRDSLMLISLTGRLLGSQHVGAKQDTSDVMF